MEHIDVIAGAPHLYTAPRFNISLNLSSVWAALFPGTRMLARLRRVHEAAVESELPSVAVEELWNDATAAASPSSSPIPVAMDEAASFPGAWGFVTSWYMIGLFIMAVFLHRIQNIVVPSRHPIRRQRHAFRFGPSYSPSRSVIAYFFTALLPLDFSHTATRLALHLPSIYLLGKMLLVWTLLIAQTSEIPIPPIMSGLMQWTVQQDMRDICWSTFSAVCIAFLVEGFVKALDGIGTGFPIGNNPNTSPFNLVGYAFLLHVYSSPITHSFTPANAPSRPDKHVIITFAIPLLQLTVFHLLSVSKRLSTHRLIPTAITSFLSLLHFHGTLYSHFRKAKLAAALASSASASSASDSTATLSRPPPPSLPAHVSYPLLNYIPNMFETFLISTILLTVFLNAVVQLLIRGRIERLFSGLGIGTGSVIQEDEEGNPPGFFRSLPLEEDFGVLLLRVGIASLEATGLRGWGNEVAPILLPSRSPNHGQGLRHRFRNQLTNTNNTTTPTRSPATPSEFGMVRMGRTSVGEVQYGYGAVPIAYAGGASPVHRDDVFSSNAATPTNLRRRRALPGPAPAYPTPPNGPTPPTATRTTTATTIQRFRQGFANEVRTVDLGVPSATDAVDVQDTTGGYLGGAYIRRYFWVLVQWCGTVWGVGKGLVRVLLDRAMGRGRVGGRGVGEDGDGEGGSQREVVGRRKVGRVGVLVEGGGVDVQRQRSREVSVVPQLQETEEEKRARRERELYHRFLSGEEISDDEDDAESTFVRGDSVGPWASSDEGEESDDLDEDANGEDDAEGEADATLGGEQEAVRLFTDILRDGSSGSGGLLSESASGEMVLAHVMHGASAQTSPGPLTRRRWNALFSMGMGGYDAQAEDEVWDGEEDEDFAGEVAARSGAVGGTSGGEGGGMQHTCVICTSEGRDIICWPCRCLAMCDGCREALASKSAPTKHRCPCCRQLVEGYSRIYIP